MHQHCHSGAEQEHAFDLNFLVIPTSQHEQCQHKPDSFQMKLNRKVVSRDTSTVLQQTMGGHCLGSPPEEREV